VPGDPPGLSSRPVHSQPSVRRTPARRTPAPAGAWPPIWLASLLPRQKSCQRMAALTGLDLGAVRPWIRSTWTNRGRTVAADGRLIGRRSLPPCATGSSAVAWPLLADGLSGLCGAHRHLVCFAATTCCWKAAPLNGRPPRLLASVPRPSSSASAVVGWLGGPSAADLRSRSPKPRIRWNGDIKRDGLGLAHWVPEQRDASGEGSPPQPARPCSSRWQAAGGHLPGPALNHNLPAQRAPSAPALPGP